MNTINIINKWRIRILAFLPVLVLGLILSSCEEEIIDLDPYNQVSETVAFQTPSLIELSVMGMYNAAQTGYYAGSPQRGYPFGAANIEQKDNRGEDAVNTQAFYRYTYTNTYTPATPNNAYYWHSLYRLINRCNIVIDGVKTAQENGIIPSDQALSYEGEARLMRAMSYQELLFHFSYPYAHTGDQSHFGVPIHTTGYTSGSQVEAVKEVSRSSLADVYDLILDDYDFAEANLPSTVNRSGNFKITRATKEAAIALKTRTYLHMEDWGNVITEGLKLTSGTPVYEITATPDGPFGGAKGYSNSESIFSMENSVNSNPGVNAALASQYNRRQLVCISPIIWRNSYWLEDDLRREEDVMVFFVEGIPFTNKYTEATNMDDPCPIIRYAEVLLNMAEAYTRQGGGDVATGLVFLNEVRDRSLADPATQSYTAADFASANDQLRAILEERRIEFVLEGQRWPDIHRLQYDPVWPINGIPGKAANGYPPAADYTLGTEYTGPYGVDPEPMSSKYFLWPIPQAEIDANPILAGQQNPGW